MLKFCRYPHYSPLNNPQVVTIGNFDGVHIGHQVLIKKVTDFAQKHNFDSCVVSMQPLASQYFAKSNRLPLLTPFKCKFALIQNLGIDTFCVLNFNKNLAELSATEFIKKVLIQGLKAKHIIIGDDFRFGKGRKGDFNFLKDYCQPLKIGVEAIDTVALGSKRISSSFVRQKLAQSDFATVQDCLGRKFSIFGKVSKGQQLGRTLGFPTINIKLKNRAVPIEGIFCVKVKFANGEKYLGAASIGTRPTVNDKKNNKQKILEVNILDFNKQVYGQNVEIIFYHKLRNEVKFDSLEELKRHIAQDVIKTRLYFNETLMEPLREQ